MKQLLFITLVLTLFTSDFCNAQNKRTAIVKGKLINTTTKTPFNDLKISIPSLSVFTNSDGEGNFMFSEIPFGVQKVVITGATAKSDTILVTVDTELVDIHDINITQNSKEIAPEISEIPTIAVNDDNSNTSSEDDGVSAQGTGGAVTSSNDPFLRGVYDKVAMYNYHYRGLLEEPHEIQVNGYTINDAENNRWSWSQMGRLYDVFRTRNFAYGITPSEYSFGSINGTLYHDATAANQPEETKISYTFTDHNYASGLTFTKSSGLRKNGWAYSVSFAKRYAQQGYSPGTFYDDYAYYAAVSKKIKKGTLNLTTFGSPIDHGKSSSGTMEDFALSGTNYYNHNWGDYNGQKLNARVEKEFRPISILNYEYNPSDKTRWNTVVGYEFGKDKNSFIDDYGGNSPYGDYYRNLPSYYLTMVPPDSNTAAAIRKQILSNPQLMQINWNNLYQNNFANTQTIYNVNGITGNNYTGKRSIYVLSNNVKDLKKFTFNTNIEHALNEHITLYGGLSSILQSTESYNQVANLLGGDYYVNYNAFAAQQFIGSPTFNQNNLNNPNQVIRAGDTYGDDYSIKIFNTMLWGQAAFTYNKLNLFIAANSGDNSFSRDGYMRNGLFPNNSYGMSPAENFLTYGVKGGINYNIDRRNILFLHGAYTSTPPTSDNVYVSPTIRDQTVNDPVNQHNQSLEFGYVRKSSKLSVRAVGYATDMKNITEIKRFYNDDPTYHTFVNYVMQGENTRSVGTELLAEYKLVRSFSITGIASVGQAFYTNRPTINVYLDNDTNQHSTPSTAYIKNYYLAVGPQSTYVLGLNYHPKRDFYVNLNFNYLDRNYVEINPNRRNTQAAGLYPAGSPMWHEIFDQEKLPSAFTVDLRASKTFQLSRASKLFDNISHNSILVISGSIGNLLNNTNVINSGYEQLRFDFTNYNPDKFANKYIYGMGINFSISATLKF